MISLNRNVFRDVAVMVQYSLYMVSFVFFLCFGIIKFCFFFIFPLFCFFSLVFAVALPSPRPFPDVPLPQALSLTSPRPLHPGGRNVNVDNLPQGPTNLQAALISTGFVTLLWRQPEKSYEGEEPVTMYSVFWKEKGSDR